MILGAGIYQVPLIKKAKELGYETIVSSIPGHYPGFDCADKVYYVNTTDKEQILEICKKENVSGICTASTDVAITSIGYVCDYMHLHGISYDTAEKATNKYKMKMAFQKYGVNSAKFKKIENEEELLNEYVSLGKNVILKVVDKSGSRGISKVSNKDELLSAYKNVIQVTGVEYILMEETLSGKEIGIDGFIRNGQLEYVFPHDKLVISNGRTDVPAGHVSPLVVSENVMDNLYKQVNLVIKALGLNDCAFNIDAFIIGNDIYIIEAGARIGATGIPQLIKNSSGNDVYEQIVKTAMNQPCVFYNRFEKACMSYVLYSHVGGLLQKVLYQDVEGVEFSMDYSIGDSIPKFCNGSDRIGQLIIQGNTLTDLDNKKDMFLKNLEIKIGE